MMDLFQLKQDNMLGEVKGKIFGQIKALQKHI